MPEVAATPCGCAPSSASASSTSASAADCAGRLRAQGGAHPRRSSGSGHVAALDVAHLGVALVSATFAVNGSPAISRCSLTEVAEVLDEVESRRRRCSARMRAARRASTSTVLARTVMAASPPTVAGALDPARDVRSADRDVSPSTDSIGPRTMLLSPMKRATKPFSGSVASRRRVGDLLDPRVVHDDDAVGHRERFLLVVRHVDEHEAELALEVAQLDAHAQLQQPVEVAERLVEQERLRLRDEHARERDALLLAAGEPRGLRLGELREPDHLERVASACFAALVLVDAVHLEPERDVLEHRAVREEREVLEDRRGRPLGGRDAVTSDWPSRPMSPSVGCSWPPIMRSVVVLPQPEGPSRTTYSPWSTCRFASSTARDVAGEDAVDVLEDESRIIAARGSGDLWGFGGCAHDSGTFDGEKRTVVNHSVQRAAMRPPAAPWTYGFVPVNRDSGGDELLPLLQQVVAVHALRVPGVEAARALLVGAAVALARRA